MFKEVINQIRYFALVSTIRYSCNSAALYLLRELKEGPGKHATTKYIAF